MPSEQVERFLKNSSITIFYSEPDKKTISCYGVNEDGMIAIGSDDSTKKQILHSIIVFVGVCAWIGDVIAGSFGDEKGEILLRKFKGHSFFCAWMAESKFICTEL